MRQAKSQSGIDVEDSEISIKDVTEETRKLWTLANIADNEHISLCSRWK